MHFLEAMFSMKWFTNPAGYGWQGFIWGLFSNQPWQISTFCPDVFCWDCVHIMNQWSKQKWIDFIDFQDGCHKAEQVQKGFDCDSIFWEFWECTNHFRIALKTVHRAKRNEGICWIVGLSVAFTTCINIMNQPLHLHLLLFTHMLELVEGKKCRDTCNSWQSNALSCT